MKLYTLPHAGSIVAQVALTWAKAEHEVVKLDFAGTKTPEYLSLNPQGVVPLLDDNGFLITQNMAILNYLNQIYPEAKLFGGGDIKAQTQVQQWFAFTNSDIHSKISVLFKAAQWVETDAAQASLKANVKAQLHQLYALWDQHLQAQAQKALTIADVYVAVTMNWAKMHALDLSDLVALNALYERVMSDPAVQTVLAAQ
ncbi:MULTISPECIES: glutathione S-transferase family protein [Vitreoscilla]|uniref:Glutathione S-transferase family protein n=1 Tax=Vitreoscilla stercoraria TaxID=61 RepID=A0ABY4EBF0_VITST|nr:MULTISPECIES: glutathione S-transferase family protein [Vitreoscilla]AUZ05893.1 glutathione S-transferase [Vitreoscilla sp. C1]UOO92735.1 glutathione S-transferase family protein [Vitreoscilla stercoraria]